MHLTYSLPWWLAILLAGAIAAAAFVEYRRPLAPLTTRQRATLVALRALALTALVLFLFRPVAMLPPSGSRDAVVPILIDTSRSMRIHDADGQSRLSRAEAVLNSQLLPAIQGRFVAESFTIGEALTPVGEGTIDHLGADGRRTDISGALDAIRDRY